MRGHGEGRAAQGRKRGAGVQLVQRNLRRRGDEQGGDGLRFEPADGGEMGPDHRERA